MSRIYTITGNFSTTTACDLLAITPAADKPIRLRGFRLSQTTEFGDAQEEVLRVTVRRFTATVTAGSGGSTATPVPTDDVDTAAGFAARVGDTTVATTTGTNELKEDIGWNERNTPFEVWYPDERFAPECRLNANRLILRNETTPADSVTISLTAWVEEI